MKVKWSFQARIDYWANIDYLEDEWSENEALKFINNAEYTIGLIGSDTISFSKTRYKNVF